MFGFIFSAGVSSLGEEMHNDGKKALCAQALYDVDYNP